MKNKEKKASEFFSRYAIDESVQFRPMYHQQKEHGIADEERDGVIVAVRFTKPKVWYDILDIYSGTIFQNIDSAKVYDAPNLTIPETPKNQQ